MVGVQHDASSNVGLDEVSVLLESQQSCQRFPVEDGKFELKRCPRLAGPLNDLSSTSITLFACLCLLLQGHLSKVKPSSTHMLPIPPQ